MAEDAPAASRALPRPVVEVPRGRGCLPGTGCASASSAARPRALIPPEELESLSDEIAERVRKSVLQALDKELRQLGGAVRGHEVTVSTHTETIGALSEEVRVLRHEVRALQVACEELAASRGLLSGWLHICSPSGGPRFAGSASPRSSPSSAKWRPVISRQGGAEAAPPPAPAARAAAVAAAAAAPEPSSEWAHGLLGPALELLSAAVALDSRGQEVAEVRRAPFVDGIEALSSALDAIGGSMGSYLASNTKKLRRSTANAAEESYEAWLLSELPAHAAKGYKDYVDDSAFMANLWVGWMLDFFVEMFALLKEGKDTKASVDAAYKQTLHKHHNIIQRTAFSAACKRLPARERLLETLAGAGGQSAALRDLAALVAVGRPLVRFCARVDSEAAARMRAARSGQAA